MAKKSIKSKRSKSVRDAGVPEPETGLSPQKIKEIKASVEDLIDAFMVSVGYTNPSERTDEHGRRYFNKGSAEGRAFVFEYKGELFLRVESAIMPLPSDKDLILPLMRELLELNMHISDVGRVGIMNENVYVSVTYPISNIDKNTVPRCIHSVMFLADSIDDPLIEKYGGTSKSRK